MLLVFVAMLSMLLFKVFLSYNTKESNSVTSDDIRIERILGDSAESTEAANDNAMEQL